MVLSDLPLINSDIIFQDSGFFPILEAKRLTPKVKPEVALQKFVVKVEFSANPKQFD